jgi:hypothetical protein
MSHPTSSQRDIMMCTVLVRVMLPSWHGRLQWFSDLCMHCFHLAVLTSLEQFDPDPWACRWRFEVARVFVCVQITECVRKCANPSGKVFDVSLRWLRGVLVCERTPFGTCWLGFWIRCFQRLCAVSCNIFFLCPPTTEDEHK